jgi:hypothetical protein
MNNQLIKQLLMTCCLSGLAACATTSEDPNEAEYADAPRGNDCISQMSIRDYQVLDESNLVVTERAKRKYHVILDRRAFGLRSTWHIAFRSHSGRICSGFSDLIVDDGMRKEFIGIRSVKRLTPEDHDDLLVRFGKKEPAANQTTAPEPVKGAEVEELD